eukprot:CAMPEP_0202964174 /NCGR_PEP_ID=MMETSP1396-20130829/8247_1 /ASSEMBLY_ACC=CAM_ASM_000872 /TAXON_ID= /ORGANISM="Pseudokeronopsis sp., Strain Brazil" /LENGTH=59 /DNA_ID=CAMNT_0049686069 /DNA_START=298 /DNA_END=474 /DNA_ORIENTATION=-
MVVEEDGLVTVLSERGEASQQNNPMQATTATPAMTAPRPNFLLGSSFERYEYYIYYLFS